MNYKNILLIKNNLIINNENIETNEENNQILNLFINNFNQAKKNFELNLFSELEKNILDLGIILSKNPLNIKEIYFNLNCTEFFIKLIELNNNFLKPSILFFISNAFFINGDEICLSFESSSIFRIIIDSFITEFDSNIQKSCLCAISNTIHIKNKYLTIIPSILNFDLLLNF